MSMREKYALILIMVFIMFMGVGLSTQNSLLSGIGLFGTMICSIVFLLSGGTHEPN